MVEWPRGVHSDDHSLWVGLIPLTDTVLQCEFLRAIPRKLIPLLIDLAQVRVYPPRAILFQEGVAHGEFHIVASRHVRLDMAIPGRGRVPILSAGPGDALAWSALAPQQIMTSTAVALQPVKTIAFDGDALRQLCERNHEIGYYVMRQLETALSHRLVATRLQLLDLFADQVPVVDTAPVEGRPGDPEC